MELSARWPIVSLCREMGISRSGFYKWKARRVNPSGAAKRRAEDIALFVKYHEKYPSHGYRWLNAKIRRDEGRVMSNQYAHRCCKRAGIKSKSKHYHYKQAKIGQARYFDNAVLASLVLTGPMQCVVSDMTCFYAGGDYWELTLYMDLWNNEIVGYGLSSRKGDPETYYEGLRMVAERKASGLSSMQTILHSDRGSVYASKSFNELLPTYGFTHSMSEPGTPTDNGAMEAINGWAKTEMFIDFDVRHCQDVPSFVKEYIRFFNEERPSYALGYLTPKEYRERYSEGGQQSKKPSKIAYEKKEKIIKEAKAKKESEPKN